MFQILQNFYNVQVYYNFRNNKKYLKYFKCFQCFEICKNIHLFFYIFRQSLFLVFENIGSSFSKILNLFF